MLVCYISEETYAALADVLVEIAAPEGPLLLRSGVTGAVHADLRPGRYRAWFAKPGFGSKHVDLDLPSKTPHQVRLLSDCVLGYAWPKWVRAREAAEFRVHSPEPYELELWRYGLRKELVRKVGAFDEFGPRACIQLLPDGDFTQTGVRWNTVGYGNPVYRQFVSAPERSGLHYFHVKARSGRTFAFPWIVAPSKPAARIAVLASNVRWNAYNAFGGRNNYVNPIALPPTPTVNARQDLDRYNTPDHIDYLSEDYDPLSFDRPELINDVPLDAEATDRISGRYACGAAPAEWRVLAWLEREGFAYDYYGETHLHEGELKLEDYRVLVMSTHPEYWTRRMYLRVKDWIHRSGGRLVYLGGNGINCEVEIDGDRMVCRNGNERERVKAGTTESRFHGRFESEANLLGVVYDHIGVMTAAPYEVIEPDHWIFEGTGVRKGDIFGRETLNSRCPGGASGHEMDKISASSPPGTLLLAKGMNPDEGGAHMSIYETKSGGAVFAAASIAYGSCLLLDDVASKLTANVLRRFSAA
ncbi:MAG: N,N-dimethylformamidase beta subunit family domain-containing protein [Parvibaculaceae bacterium]